MRYAVILAGGSGTRLWPFSRRPAPKHVLAPLDAETLLEKTYRRVRGSFPADRTYVSTLAEQAAEVHRQLPEITAAQCLAEPVGRDTAAAIGYAALRLIERDPDAVFVTVNADAYVADGSAYAAAIDAAFGAAEAHGNGVALVGLTPRYPETGYGYLELAEPVGDRLLAPIRAVRFVEKPDAVTAAEYVASGRYLWNPALFVFRADRLLALLAEHLPQHAVALASLRNAENAAAVARAFLAMPKISIDCGIMERLNRLVVIPASFGWVDVGSWRAVHEILSAERGTIDVVRGLHVGVGGSGNLVVAPNGKLVATCGIDDCVIIDTSDALLICPRNRSQDVKRIVEELERRGLNEYL